MLSWIHLVILIDGVGWKVAIEKVNGDPIHHG